MSSLAFTPGNDFEILDKSIANVIIIIYFKSFYFVKKVKSQVF